MGKQIQISLTPDDEKRLAEFLASKYPVEVVDRWYAPYWDHRTLMRNPNALSWVIMDTRAREILINSATVATTGPWSGWWQICSRGQSCVDWDRAWSVGDRSGDGRLYLNTSPDPIWTETSAETGDDVPRLYEAACRWIRQNCVNCSKGRHAFWVSRSRVEATTLCRDDPRDDGYYLLQRKKKSKLTGDEIVLYISYCDRMIDYVSKDTDAVVSWESLKQELASLIPSQTKAST